jgi:glycosyltransferase involved in cell wall biosynthesis
MRIVILNPGEDTGGVGIAIKHAFMRHAPGWTVTHIRHGDNTIHYPGDLDGNEIHAEGIKRLVEQCDVLHLMERPDGIEKLDLVGATPLVLHHHGVIYRDEYRKEIDAFIEQVRPVVLASTLDLVPLGKPPVTWLPNPQNLDRLDTIRRLHDKRFDFMHAPTVRERKNTAEFIQAAAQIQASYELIERVSWDDCLNRKAQGRILYDQLVAGYGLNALEAWGMGMPVIAGTTDPATRDTMLSTIGYLPFYEATVDTLADSMLALREDVSLRASYAERGLAYVHDWHDERRIVHTLKQVYQRAYDEYHATR